MTDKLLTLIIPSYNMEDYLDRCLSSLLVDPEKMDLFEALIINDGSSDRTSEIGHFYESRFPNTFHVIDKENGHYGSCVNRGLQEARGTYFKILDADDYFSPDFTEYLVFLNNTDADLVLTDCVIKDERGVQISRGDFPLPARETLAIKDLLMAGVGYFDHFRLTYRYQILKESGYHQTEGISYTDLEWSSLPFCNISSIVYLPETIYCYIRGRAGQSVDIAYRKNNMWMENQVVLDLVRKYEKLKHDLAQDNVALFKAIISAFVQTVYRHYLILEPHALQQSDLMEFDSKLRQVSEEIYQSVTTTKEARKFGTYYYVRDFRTNGKRGSKYYFYDLCMQLGYLLNRIRKK